MNEIYVGKFCSISDTVLLDGGLQHNARFVTTYPLWKVGCPENRSGMCKGDIVIGNDVWIGDGAMIMSGVSIGDGAIIGARTVVTHDVKPYAIVAGAPQRFIRWRFDEITIERLMAVRWWDWPTEKIQAFGPLMLSENIELFLEKAES